MGDFYILIHFTGCGTSGFPAGQPVFRLSSYAIVPKNSQTSR